MADQNANICAFHDFFVKLEKWKSFFSRSIFSTADYSHNFFYYFSWKITKRITVWIMVFKFKKKRKDNFKFEIKDEKIIQIFRDFY